MNNTKYKMRVRYRPGKDRMTVRFSRGMSEQEQFSLVWSVVYELCRKSGRSPFWEAMRFLGAVEEKREADRAAPKEGEDE